VKKDRLSMIGLLILQVVAVLLYPLSFFRSAPQAAVLPPALLIFILLAVAGMNSGVLTPVAGRVFLVFVQGLNVVMRLMTIPPHMRASSGWNWPFLVLSLISIILSWATIVWMERRHPRTLLLRRAESGE
jgi:hypothetical protein